MDCKIAENPSIVESLEWSISLIRILNLLYSGILCNSGKNLTDGGVHYYKVLLYIISCCLNITISYDKTWFWFFFHLQAKDWTKIIKVLLLNQPFSQSLTLKKKLSHLNSFMDHHFSTKKQKTAKICMWWKKTNIIYICPALSSQVWKNPEPRFTRKQKKSPGTLPSKKKYKFGFSCVKDKSVV